MSRLTLRRPAITAPVLRWIVPVLALCLAFTAVVLTVRTDESDRRVESADTHEDAVRAAERVVTEVITIDPATLRSDLAGVLALTTGDLRTQLADQRSDFLDAVRQAGVSARASIAGSAVQSAGPDRVVVLVAAAAAITNPRTPSADRRAYRMRVTVDRVEGEWLVSSLELVP